MVFDDTLIDEDTRGSVADVDEDRIVRSIDRINYESIGVGIGIEQQIRILVCKICSGTIQVADDARIVSASRRKDGIIRTGVDMVGFEVEVVKG